MYCMYTNPLGVIIKRHVFKHHCYIDDSQVYMILKIGDNMDEVVHATEDCLADISTWMANNLLKLNQNKTELIVFFIPSKVLTKLGIFVSRQVPEILTLS